MGAILMTAIYWFARFLTTALLVRAVMSWFVRDPYSTLGKIYMVVIRFTEPMVEPCRRLLAKLNLNTGMFDFSVLLAFFMIEIVATICMNIVVRIFTI
ncbi:MAG: YggT family protein [Spirochaetaceae bacterium]|nr:YggT family protein [Spirochaetaceae bacterium]